MNESPKQATYTDEEVTARLASDLPHWRLEDGCLRRTYKTGGWKASLLATNAIGHLAEAAWHHPDLQVSYGSVTVSLITHSAGGITDKDFVLARKIEEVVDWRPGQEGGPLEGTPDDDRYRYLKYD